MSTAPPPTPNTPWWQREKAPPPLVVYEDFLQQPGDQRLNLDIFIVVDEMFLDFVGFNFHNLANPKIMILKAFASLKIINSNIYFIK